MLMEVNNMNAIGHMVQMMYNMVFQTTWNEVELQEGY
jgi:hypothetical protein